MIYWHTRSLRGSAIFYDILGASPAATHNGVFGENSAVV